MKKQILSFLANLLFWILAGALIAYLVYGADALNSRLFVLLLFAGVLHSLIFRRSRRERILHSFWKRKR